MRFRSYLDGSERFMGPETSMEVQAALGSDIALVFDECTPFHVTPRLHRALDRAHAPLARPLPRLARRARPAGQVVYGIVQGGVDEDLRRASAQEVAARGRGGIAIGGTLGEDKAQMYEVVELGDRRAADERPRHLLGIGEIDDLVRGVELGIDTFDCAMPTRIGRHGMAIVPDPEDRWRVDLAKGRYRGADEPMLEGCPCPACAARLLARLPALPAEGARADRRAAAHAPQPRLRAAADGGAARRDRRRAAGRGGRGRARAGAAPWELATSAASARLSLDRGP